MSRAERIKDKVIRQMNKYFRLCTRFVLPLVVASPGFCGVTPMIGGGQVSMMNASMKHIDIAFDGSDLLTHVDESVGIPLLRALQPPDEFDESAPWSILQEKAYNFQYGWNAGGFITLPPGTSIWIESLHSAPGLEAYSRPPANPAWTPIFGTNGSSSRWKWSGAMTHNVYAVLDPKESQYTADYRVYLGDPITGDAADRFGSSFVTLTFQATPILPGDFDQDGLLTVVDIDQLTDAIIDQSTRPRFDLNNDATIDREDHTYWVKELKQTWIGDADLNGEFDSSDMIQVFLAGKYDMHEDAGWSEGDWTSDRRFNSSDFIAAFLDGGYGQGQRTLVVPEPSAWGLSAAAGIFVFLRYRQRIRRKCGDCVNPSITGTLAQISGDSHTMTIKTFLYSILLSAAISITAHAQTTPPPPAMTNGGDPANTGMKHINVALSGTTLSIHVGSPPNAPVTMMSGHGIDFTDDKFSVLEGVYFNAQHGWLPEGLFDDLPANGSIWIERTAATLPANATFRVYEGGNMREGMDAWTMNEVYTSDGDVWQWDGAMQHDYFTADLPGNYSMSYAVYVGDINGNPLPDFESASTTLDFVVVPEPAAGTLAALGVLGILLRRRERRKPVAVGRSH